jgi:carbonic anhydrase
MAIYVKSHIDNVTPDSAMEYLIAGNERFMNGYKANRDLLNKIEETKDGQNPFAAILSCMDSRAPAELIFDQGIGDIFNIRIAGNVVSPYVLGSLEYAVAVAGSKLIVVMGHTNCGAVKGACDDVQLGNLTALLDQIKDSIKVEDTEKDNRTGNNKTFVDKVATLNVQHSANQLLEQSEIIREHVETGKIKLVGAMYNLSTGKVTFQDVTPASN